MEKGVKDKKVIVETLFWLGLAIIVLSFLYDQLFVITIPIGLACMILAGLESLLSKGRITKKISKFEELSKILLFLILNLMIALSLKPRLPSWRKSIMVLLQLPPAKTWWLNIILGLIAGLILLFILTNLYIFLSERKIKKLIKKPKEKVVKAILEKIRNWPKRPREIRKRIALGEEIPKDIMERYRKLIDARLKMKECLEKALKAGYSLEKIEKITKSLGWSEGETRILIKEVVRMGRKYVYSLFFLLGTAIVIACLFNVKTYPVILLIGIAIMIVAILSYPKIKIKKEKIKLKKEKAKIKPVREKIKPKIPKISVVEKIKSIFRKKLEVKKEKKRIKEEKEKPKPKIPIREKIKNLFEKRRKIKEERKKWGKKEKVRKRKGKEEEKKRIKEEKEKRKEERAQKRKKLIEEFKENIKLSNLFKKRIPKEKIKPEKPPKEKIKPKKEDLHIIRAIRESVAKAEKHETNLDTLFKLVKKYGRLRLSTVAIGFNIGKSQAEEWARILEEHKLSKTHYPAVGEPEIRKIEEPKGESEESEKEKTKKE